MEKDIVFLIESLTKLPTETEWVEFKANHQPPEKIGECISALANSACLHQKDEAYLIFGIENKTHKIIGTTFDFRQAKGKGGEPLQSWLVRGLKPNLEFKIFDLNSGNGKKLTVFYVPPASNGPVKFYDKAHIRIGDTTKPLSLFPDKEAVIWERRTPFEDKIAKEDVSEGKILQLLDYDSYFRLANEARPKTDDRIVEKLLQESFLLERRNELHITNLGAITLAHDLRNFGALENKGVRVITYKGINRLHAVQDILGLKGYAAGWENLIAHIHSQIPKPETIGKALRISKSKFPDESLREFVANALVHQDFSIAGQSPIVEIFDDRIEILNPGSSLIPLDRFIDHPPKSRNEKLVDRLRRMKICEKRGSGVDRAILSIELARLPAPKIERHEDGVRVTMYAERALNKLTKEEQCSACYLHSCIKHVVERDSLTNVSLCNRLGIQRKNSAIASRIIKKTLEQKLIKPFDPANKSNRYKKYVPYWVI